MHGSLLRCIRSLPRCLLRSHKDSRAARNARNTRDKPTADNNFNNSQSSLRLALRHPAGNDQSNAMCMCVCVCVGRIEPNDSQLPAGATRCSINLLTYLALIFQPMIRKFKEQAG